MTEQNPVVVILVSSSKVSCGRLGRLGGGGRAKWDPDNRLNRSIPPLFCYRHRRRHLPASVNSPGTAKEGKRRRRRRWWRKKRKRKRIRPKSQPKRPHGGGRRGLKEHTDDEKDDLRPLTVHLPASRRVASGRRGGGAMV